MPKQLKIVVCEIWCVKTLRLNGRKKMITKGGRGVKKMILRKNIHPCKILMHIRCYVILYKFILTFDVR